MPPTQETENTVSAEDIYVFPASYAQQRMWFLYQLEPDNPFYNVAQCIHLAGSLNISALEQSLNAIIKRHEALRTTFATVEGRPMQIVAPASPLTLLVKDLECPKDAKEAEVRRFAIEEARRPFDLVKGPLLRATLLRLDAKEHVLLLTMHHIICDGWSLGVFARELTALYNAFSAGKPSPLPDLAIQYADFTLWQRERLQGQVVETQRAYWKRQLENITELRLPTDYARPTAQSLQGARHPVAFSKELSEAVKTLSQRAGVTLFMTLMTAYQALLHRYTGQDDIAVSSAIAGRSRPELEGLIGFFVNILVLRTDVSGDPTFRELLGRVREVCMAAHLHQDLPFEQVVAELHPERDWNRNPLLQISFSIQNPPLGDLELVGLTASPVELETGVARIDLELHLWETRQGLNGVWIYRTDLFKASTIARMAGHFQTLLEAAMADPDQRLSELPLLTEAERRQLLVEWNPKPAQYPKGPSVHRLFEAQATQTPEAEAVACGRVRLTYTELNRQANQVARHLQQLGVRPSSHVGICMERSVETVIGLLGILKAGGACVPLDPAYPKEHLTFALRDAEASVLLTKARWAGELCEAGAHIVCLDSDWNAIGQQSGENMGNEAKEESLAYILYSSGRGILVEHQAVRNRLDWLQNKFNLSGVDSVLHRASLAHDAVALEVLWPLAYGARVVIAPEGQDDAENWQRLITEQKVSTVRWTPSELREFVAALEKSQASEVNSLRWVLCGGEPLECALVDRFLQHIECGLYNLYGPPEAAMEVTAQACRPKETSRVMPVGNPTSYVSVYVLDKDEQLVPIGLTGEIYIGGARIARGYWHDTKETARRFIQNPFAEAPGERLFKTGDRGRWSSDGTLELLGCTGRQAWMGGWRIEPEQVEAALMRDPSVDRCAVIAKENQAGKQELVACVVPTGRFSAERLQAHAEKVLPRHQRPQAYMAVSNLPLTPDGQVNEKVLADLPVLDGNVIEEWEKRVQSEPEIKQVAVVVREREESFPPLHLTDVLPEWKSAQMSAAAKSAMAKAQAAAASETEPRRQALSVGEPLRLEADAPRTLPEALRRAVKQAPEKGTIYVQNDCTEIFQPYPALLEEAERILCGLRRLGLKPQDKVMFQLERNQDFIPALWGCLLGGFIPAPISVAAAYEASNVNARKMHSAWQMLERPLILTSAALVPAIRSLSDVLDMEGLQVETIDHLRTCDPDRAWHTSAPEDVALLALTSGSTGLPKGILLSHRNMLSMLTGVIQMNGFTNLDVFWNWMPMDHAGTIAFLNAMPIYLCSQQVHVPTFPILQDPLKWLDWNDRHKATITWAPNFAFGLINDQAEEISRRHWDLSALRFIINGGEAVVTKTIRKFLALLRPHGLPTTAVHPAFGMSETCSGITWSNSFSLESSSDDDQLVELGPPIPGASLRIVDDNGQLVDEGTVGRFQVKGPSLTRGYYRNPELNQEVFTPDGWFDTGDLGFIKEGVLTITGRAKDMIIIRGTNYYSHEIESVVEEVKGVEVTFTAACAVHNPNSDTDELAVFFNTSVSDGNRLLELLKEIRAKLARSVGVTPDYLIPVDKEAIPKTAIGKIQRTHLRRRFEAGEFDAILKHMDILSRNVNTLPDWFYRKVWRRKEATPPFHETGQGQTIVFLDRLGLGERLCAELEQLGHRCVKVEAGSDWRLDRDRYCINPREPEHYRQLVTCLAAKGPRIDRVAHLWTYGEYAEELLSLEALEQAQDWGVYSLLFLAQALASVEERHPIGLYAVSSHTQFVRPGDKLACENASLLGLVKTIPQEMPWLECCHVDLPVENTEACAAWLAQEVRSAPRDREVAWRNGQRWAARLEKADLRQTDKRPIPFRPGGMYLISGGLGGIGAEIAKYLLKQYAARLVLVGRTRLPERSEWEAHAGREDGCSRRIQTFQMLEQAGGQVVYEAADVCDVQRLGEIVEQAETRWGCKLDGILHLAGVLYEQSLAESSRESWATTLRAKVGGTWALHQILQERPGAMFIGFSSVNGFLGGARAGAYAAANSFMDGFCEFLHRQGTLQSHCFAWSMWDETGMSRGYPLKELSQARGYSAISVERGLQSLLVGLCHGDSHLLIGLDGGNQHIRRHIEGEAYPLEALTAYLTTHTDQASLASLHELMVRDRFQTATSCEFVQIPEMPLTPDGKVDRAALLTLAGLQSRSQEAHIAPRTDIERTIAAIWQEVLHVDKVGVRDNFFDLGGNSMLVVQAQSKLSQAFGKDVSVADMFKYPTISALAKYLGQEQAEKPSFEKSRIRTEARRGSAKRQREFRQKRPAKKNE